MAKFGYLRKNGAELIICKRSMISYPPHNHVSVYTIGFVLDGAIELGTDKGLNIYHENDVFVIPPYAPHYINPMSRYTLLSLCVGADLLSDPEFIKSDVVDFLHNSISQSAMEEKILRILSGIILINPMLPARNVPAVDSLKTELETYPELKYSVDDMAKTVFMSKYNFIRAFKREVGLTPHRFQLQNRIRKAQRLLEESYTVAEVALAAGFCDQSHFIRHFRKIVGITPTSYKTACNVSLPISID